MKRLSAEAFGVLTEGLSVEGQHVRITAGQLDRKLYLEVNAALEAIGGAWNKKARVHVFAADPSEALDQILVDGGFHDTKRDFDQFDTPAELAMEVVRRAEVRGKDVLEPSAGTGRLAKEAMRQGAHTVTCFEVDEKRARGLTLEMAPFERYQVTPCDFLAQKTGGGVRGFEPYPRIVMNPPFSRGKDIDHVTHALSFLSKGGRLVAILSAGVTFRQDRKARTFRELVSSLGGTLEPLPDTSFRESGTDVRTVLLTVTR
jgi:predicted RNA methylase